MGQHAYPRLAAYVAGAEPGWFGSHSQPSILLATAWAASSMGCVGYTGPVLVRMASRHAYASTLNNGRYYTLADTDMWSCAPFSACVACPTRNYVRGTMWLDQLWHRWHEPTLRCHSGGLVAVTSCVSESEREARWSCRKESLASLSRTCTRHSSWFRPMWAVEAGTPQLSWPRSPRRPSATRTGSSGSSCTAHAAVATVAKRSA